ncbi:uncharacterized protein LOC143427217 [Xylocopa sonorina]|uniref:uncharacterized protein LOC143427217 n=1 Tax=Xylocopa sonorina TaxID=1818115 RepID=UPI00403AB2E8
MMASKTTISRPLEYSLRLFGAWPDSSCQMLKTVIWTMIMLTFLVFQCWYCITHIKSGLVELLDGWNEAKMDGTDLMARSHKYLQDVYLRSHVRLYHASPYSWIFTTSTPYHLHHFRPLVVEHSLEMIIEPKTFYEILATILEDSNDYNPTIENRRIMADKATLSSRISNFLIGYFGLSFLLYTGLTLVLFDEDQIASDSKQRKFLIRMEFPFDATSSPQYEIILVTQFILESLIVYLAATTIALIAALILHVGSQIEVFCQNLQEISCIDEKEESRILAMKEIVVKHERIIRLSKKVETIFSYISLYQFLSNTLMIKFKKFNFINVIYMIMKSLHTEQATILIVKCFPYYIAINCEAFILCYTGEYLTSKSETITKSVYNFLWYNLKPQEARSILLVILRSQKQLKLTAGKFISLSLEAFANVRVLI